MLLSTIIPRYLFLKMRAPERLATNLIIWLGLLVSRHPAPILLQTWKVHYHRRAQLLDSSQLRQRLCFTTSSPTCSTYSARRMKGDPTLRLSVIREYTSNQQIFRLLPRFLPTMSLVAIQIVLMERPFYVFSTKLLFTLWQAVPQCHKNDNPLWQDAVSRRNQCTSAPLSFTSDRRPVDSCWNC